MSEQEHQPPDKPKRVRATQGTRHAGRKQTQQATFASPKVQRAAVSLTTQDTISSAAPQALPAAEAPAQPTPDEPPIGERWGEFPPLERRADLKQRLEAWEQEQDHGTRPGPFAYFQLTGADVYWLAALTTGAGEVERGKKKLDTHPFVDLSGLHLEGADLRRSRLEGATLSRARLEGADLSFAHLEEANLSAAEMERANLDEAEMEGADLSAAEMEGAHLNFAHLEEARLFEAQMEGVILLGAHLERADLSFAHLEGARLFDSYLEGAGLLDAHLEGADLSFAHLEGANLLRAHLEGANLLGAQLISNVDLRNATFDAKTLLADVQIDATLLVADVAWNGVPLIRMPWGQVPHLGDEILARKVQTEDGERKGPLAWLEGYETAFRAYRQLAIALRGQGIIEAADRFTYRALIMQRKSLWWQLRGRKFSKLGAYLFSLFLAVLTGYGFRLWRMIVAYGLLILAFAGAYWSLDLQRPQPFSFWQAIILSVTAFHGRVFSNPFNLSDPQIVVTAVEAIVGLVIEGVFIAMLTQRFFNH